MATTSPFYAIILLSCTTLALTNVSFTSLLGVDTLFNAINVVLVTASFLRLRYSTAEKTSLARQQGYTLPGGMKVAWLVAMATFICAFLAIAVAAAAAWTDLAVASSIVLAVYAIGWVRERGYLKNMCLGFKNCGGSRGSKETSEDAREMLLNVVEGSLTVN